MISFKLKTNIFIINLFKLKLNNLKHWFIQTRKFSSLNMAEGGIPFRSRSIVSLVKQRIVLAFMGLLSLANAYCHRFSLGIAITEMVKHHISAHQKIDPDACPYDPEFEGKDRFDFANAEFEWSEDEMKFLQSAFFIGYVISHVPGGIMADIYGGKQVVGFGLLLSAICTLLTPPAARLGVWWLFALRIAMGIFQGPTYPSLNNMMSHWAPIGERGRIGAMIFAGAQLGNTVNFLGTGFLISTFRAWETPFYVFGVIGIIWFLLWQVLCYNDPMTHPFISEQEKRFLMASSVGQLKKRADLPRTPILQMMMSIPLWALILAQIGHDWGIFTLLTVMPIYFKSVLHFSLKQNAVLSAAPNLLMWFAAIFSGYIVDCMINNGFGITFVRKLFVTIASFGPCLGMLLVGYAGCDKVGVSIPFIIGMGTMGAFVPSLKVNALDLSPNYAGTTLAFVNGIGSLAGIASPALVAILTPNSTLAEWRIVFWVVFGIMNATNLIYILFGSAEVQKWDEG